MEIDDLNHEESKNAIIEELFGKNFGKMDTYIEKSRKLINKEVLKMDKKIDKKKFLEALLEVYMESSKDQLFSNLLVLHQDVYFLTRLFMKFEKSKMERGPVGCREEKWEEMRNIIVYAGNAHIRTYVSFFEKYFGKDPHQDFNISSEPEEEYKQCIELPYQFDFFTQK